MMLSDHKCGDDARQATMCSRPNNIDVFDVNLTKFSTDILIVKQNRKNLKSPTHFCKMCGYGDFSSTRVRRHLLLRHHSIVTKSIQGKMSILAGCLTANNCNSHAQSDSEPESPLSTKLCDDLPEDLSVHSDISTSDNDENLQVVPQFKATPKTLENNKSVIVSNSKKSTFKRGAASCAPAQSSILKRRLLGEYVTEEIEASEATLNANEINVKMIYHNSKFIIDSSEAFWLKGYKLPPRYELAQQQQL